jgi:hypothetical protein
MTRPQRVAGDRGAGGVLLGRGAHSGDAAVAVGLPLAAEILAVGVERFTAGDEQRDREGAGQSPAGDPTVAARPTKPWQLVYHTLVPRRAADCAIIGKRLPFRPASAPGRAARTCAWAASIQRYSLYVLGQRFVIERLITAPALSTARARGPHTALPGTRVKSSIGWPSIPDRCS